MMPQWSPVMKTGNTRDHISALDQDGASMEPGHEDREYFCHVDTEALVADASMEPGHEDREYEKE